MFYILLLYVNSCFVVIFMGKRELVALLSLSSWCLMIVVWLFVLVPWVCLQFCDCGNSRSYSRTILGVVHANNDSFGESAYLLGIV